MPDTYSQFLEVMNDLASARRELEHLLNLFAWERERWPDSDLAIRIRDRVDLLPTVGIMVEASFRLLKHVQHGDDSNLRQAGELWVKAAKGPLTGGGLALEVGEETSQ